MTFYSKKLAIAILGFALLLTGCGGGSDGLGVSSPNNNPPAGSGAVPVFSSSGGTVTGSVSGPAPAITPPAITNGQLKVFLETNPTLGFSQINLGINRVQVHTDANADADTAGWRDVTMPSAVNDNFLNFTDSTKLLAQGSVPAGIYKKVKIIFAKNDSIYLSNYLIGNSGNQNGKVFPIYLRSPQADAFLISTNVEVKSAETASLGITLNLRSLAKNNDLDSAVGAYIFTPIAAATDLSKAGSIEINLGTTDGTVVVSAQRGGKIVRNKIPTSTGIVKLTQLPFSTDFSDRYQVVLSSPNYATKVIVNFPVSISDKPMQFLSLKEAVTLDLSDQKILKRVLIAQTSVNAPADELELLAVETLQIVSLPNDTGVLVDYGYTPLIAPRLQNTTFTATINAALPQIINYLDFSSFYSSYGQTNWLSTVRINPDFNNAKELSANQAQTTIIFE